MLYENCNHSLRVTDSVMLLFFITEIPDISWQHSTTSSTEMDCYTGYDTFISCQGIFSTGMWMWWCARPCLFRKLFYIHVEDQWFCIQDQGLYRFQQQPKICRKSGLSLNLSATFAKSDTTGVIIKPTGAFNFASLVEQVYSPSRAPPPLPPIPVPPHAPKFAHFWHFVSNPNSSLLKLRG